MPSVMTTTCHTLKVCNQQWAPQYLPTKNFLPPLCTTIFLLAWWTIVRFSHNTMNIMILGFLLNATLNVKWTDFVICKPVCLQSKSSNCIYMYTQNKKLVEIGHSYSHTQSLGKIRLVTISQVTNDQLRLVLSTELTNCD